MLVDKLRKLLSREQGHDSLITPHSEKVLFLLQYNGLPIGQLSISDGEWTFVYTDAFKEQNEIKALIDFPILDKEYNSKKLWPFFSIRIPSLAQPTVQKIIKDENIDKDNTVNLLKHFGKWTIANPFELAVAS